jgi:hypothetical protein
MVQIWFGNTYLSFGQATSFHPVFGPILMTCYAALSGTLLLTSAYSCESSRCRSLIDGLVLICILSNTAARIDAVSDTSASYRPCIEMPFIFLSECYPGGKGLSEYRSVATTCLTRRQVSFPMDHSHNRGVSCLEMLQSARHRS